MPSRSSNRRSSGHMLSRGRTANVALASLLAAVFAAAVGVVFWGSLILLPFINILALPCFALSAIILIYALPFIAYLLLAQTDAPTCSRGVFLPLHPRRNVALFLPIIKYILIVCRLYPKAFAEWTFQRILVLSRIGSEAGAKSGSAKKIKSGSKVVKENIPYHPADCGDRRCNLLDVYLPPGFEPTVTTGKSKGKAIPQPRYFAPPQTNKQSSATRSGVNSTRSSSPASPSPSSGYGGGSPLTSNFSGRGVNESSEGGSGYESDSTRTLAPTVILIMDVGCIGPVRPNKWMFALAGMRLREQGYCVLIPDISCYPNAGAREMVGDIRRVLNWAWNHAPEYGGSRDDIHLLGHGLGGHLALLTVTQEAIVRSRDQYLKDKARLRQSQYDMTDDGWSSSASLRKVRGSVSDEDDGAISNGLRRVKVYEEHVAIPQVSSLILLAPVTDVLKQIRHESLNYWEHLAPTRRALGPSQTACMLHSPAHLLFAAKTVLQVERLPPRIMILHGGQDIVTPVTQSLYLREVLVGLAVPVVKFVPYRDLGHVEIMQTLMKGMDTGYSRWLLKDLRNFIGT